MFQRKQNCCGFGELLSLIGLNGAFDNGGVCGDGERLCKCSSLIIDDDDGDDDDGTAAATAIATAVSSRSMPSNKGNGGICANGTGGVAGARGDNSGGVVGVIDIAIDIVARVVTSYFVGVVGVVVARDKIIKLCISFFYIHTITQKMNTYTDQNTHEFTRARFQSFQISIEIEQAF